MTESKRFQIKKSILTDGYTIIDSEKEYTFPTLISNGNHMFCKALNELHEENVQLKEENKELHELLREYVDSWSDEKKQALSEISNAILGGLE